MRLSKFEDDRFFIHDESSCAFEISDSKLSKISDKHNTLKQKLYENSKFHQI